MKAIVYTKYGNPDNLTLQDVEQPTPKESEVQVHVQAASINSWDLDLLRGKPFINRIGGIRKPSYSILGADVAGKVTAVGSGVKEFRLGDVVFGDISGCGWGGFAEYVCVPEKALSRKPSSMTFQQAAAIPQAAVLALQALRKSGEIHSGQRILINGAGGGVGTFALQIAKIFGAEVTGVDRAEKLEMLQTLGADEVIDYKQKNFKRYGKRYDLILDVVGTCSIADCKRMLQPQGAYIMIGGPTTRILKIACRSAMNSKNGRKLSLLIHKPNRDDQDVIREYFENGYLTPVIDRCYPLSETAEAMRYFEKGLALGKVVIRMDEALADG